MSTMKGVCLAMASARSEPVAKSSWMDARSARGRGGREVSREVGSRDVFRERARESRAEPSGWRRASVHDCSVTVLPFTKSRKQSAYHHAVTLGSRDGTSHMSAGPASDVRALMP